MADVEFPAWSQGLFEKHRYKIAYGGRGGSKSWTFIRALILEVGKGKRVLCTREVQRSLRDSVHQLIADQIAAMGLENHYDITDNEIRGPHGGSFLFAGLSGQTADSLKSLEGIDIAFCEEAQSISDKSWNTLIPTIRKEGSEIWISFNPGLDSDPTWKRFVESPPPDSFVCKVNYTENAWFPAVLEQERLHCLATDPEGYKTIWLGECRAAIEGAIYASEITEAIVKGRICPVPYDPRLKVHCIFDLGWADSMSIILVQKGQFELRVIDHIEDDHKTLDWYLSTLKDMKLNWGHDWIPHDGATKDFKTGKSTYDLIKKFGRSPKMVPNIGIEPGIKLARGILNKTYFDKDKTKRLQECLRRYRRNINTHDEATTPIHDEYSHSADAFRYLAVVADQLTNEDDGRNLPFVPTTIWDREIGY